MSDPFIEGTPVVAGYPLSFMDLAGAGLEKEYGITLDQVGVVGGEGAFVQGRAAGCWHGAAQQGLQKAYGIKLDQVAPSPPPRRGYLTPPRAARRPRSSRTSSSSARRAGCRSATVQRACRWGVSLGVWRG